MPLVRRTTGLTSCLKRAGHRVLEDFQAILANIQRPTYEMAAVKPCRAVLRIFNSFGIDRRCPSADRLGNRYRKPPSSFDRDPLGQNTTRRSGGVQAWKLDLFDWQLDVTKDRFEPVTHRASSCGRSCMHAAARKSVASANPFPGCPAANIWVFYLRDNRPCNEHCRMCRRHRVVGEAAARTTAMPEHSALTLKGVVAALSPAISLLISNCRIIEMTRGPGALMFFCEARPGILGKKPCCYRISTPTIGFGITLL